MTLNALVLAGSRGGTDPVAAYAGVSDKALALVAGRSMLAHAVATLRTAGATRIAVVHSSPAVRDAALALGAEVIDAAPGPSESTARGLDLLGAPLLVTTADHPLLTPVAVAEFLAGVPADADLAILLAERRVVERDVGATRRTYLRFADGAWSGCNLFHLATPRAAAAIALWREVEANRKKPWRIVRRLRPTLLLHYVLGRLSLDRALGGISTNIGVHVVMVPARSGRLAVDVDKPADLDLVRRLLG